MRYNMIYDILYHIERANAQNAADPVYWVGMDGQRAMLWQGHAPKPHDQTKGLGKDENKAPEPRLQNRETQRHGGPKRPKNGPETEPSWGRKRGV